MSSERIQKMSVSLERTMMNLYLDYPGTGEFTWEKIEDNLPSKHLTNYNRHVLFTKSDIKDNMPEIMRELRDRGVNIVRKGNYYKIVNIEEIINSADKANEIHFQAPNKYKELWGGSGIVGEPLKEN